MEIQIKLLNKNKQTEIWANYPFLIMKISVCELFCLGVIHCIVLLPFACLAVDSTNNVIKGTPWDETFSMLSILKI